MAKTVGRLIISHVWATVLVHVVVVVVVVVLAFLHLLVQFRKDLLSFDVLVEVKDVATQVDHHLNFSN